MDATTLNNLSLDVAAANRGQFRLAIAGLNAKDVTFVNMRSDAHAISEDYCFDINLQLKQTIDIAKYIGAAAYFETQDNAGPISVHGLISAISFMGHRPDGEAYFVQMRSMLFPLKHNLQNRVFINKDAKQILEEVLLSAKFNTAEFEFKTQGSYPVREFTVQYDESDYDFLCRIMAYEGIFYVIQQTDKGAKIVIYDNSADLPSFEGGELMFERQSGTTRASQTVFGLRREYQLHSENVRLKDYNYRTPEVSLETTANRATAVSGAGQVYRYGENFKTLDEGSRIAKLRQQSLDWQREVYVADTDCRGMRPGMLFSLSNHPNDALNGDYLILKVDHSADQAAGHARGPRPSSLTYRNQLTLIKAGIPYRMAVPETRYINGVFTCKVETTGGDYAYLDEQGRYHLRMPYDLSTTPDGQASHPVRQAQTYSGQDYGMHFPLHAGTEVIVTCINGDIDRPIMLGAVHNPELPNLVTSTNHSQNLLRSWGDNELLMEDRKGEERIDLFTRLKKNILTLDAKAGEHHIYLGTEEGEMEQYAAKTMQIESGDSMTIQSGNDHIITVENAHSLMTNNKEIEFKAKTDIRQKAGNNVILQSETENIEMRMGKDMVVDVQNNLSLEVRNKDLNIVVSNGNFEIKAAKAITVKGQGGGNITVSQAGGSVVIDTGGAITIAGTTVNIDGNAVYLKGASVKQGGGGSGSGASGGQGGTNIQNLRLAAVDLFTHLAQQAQDVAGSINSSTIKQSVQEADLTVEQIQAEAGSILPDIEGL